MKLFAQVSPEILDCSDLSSHCIHFLKYIISLTEHLSSQDCPAAESEVVCTIVWIKIIVYFTYKSF